VQISDPDARLGVHRRQYKTSVPSSYDEHRPMPLMFYFHGQGGTDVDEDNKFVQLGNQELGNHEAFLVVSPKGMTDGAKRYGDCTGTSTAWNVGSAGRLDVCSRECQPSIHLSCLHTSNVSNCNWATCYNDFHFFRSVLLSVKSDLCIDVSRMYGVGVSNGAMFLYALIPRLPQGTFAAIVPWYGAYLQNMRQDPPRGSALLHLHGVLDKTIPAEGTYADRYYYTSLNETLEGWAGVNGCDVGARLIKVATDWDDAAKPMTHHCMRFQSCRFGVVVRCLFSNQAHGFWPGFGEKFTWWFMRNYSSTQLEEVLL
jgi:poly(3-hydroxybutyrate) depolymerase